MKLHFIKKLYSTALAVSIIYTASVFSACTYSENNEYSTEQPLQYEQSETEPETETLALNPKKIEKTSDIGETIPITRGLAAKMLALTFGTKSEINSTERTITFSDTSIDKWYDKYINYACSKKYIQGSNGKFMPEEYLTVIQAQYIIEQIDPANKIKINITDETKDKPISYNLWTEIYMKVLTNLADKSTIKEKFGISAQKTIILALPENNKLVKDGYVITDKGLLKCVGIDLTQFIDDEISLWTKDDEIIALSDITNKNPIIKNSYITENGKTCTIFSGGAEKTYEKTENFSQSETDENLKIADVTLTDKKISRIDYVTEIKEKQIKSFTETTLNCVDNETFDISPDFKVYYIQNNKVMLGKKDDILEGKTYELHIKDGKIQAFIFSRL